MVIVQPNDAFESLTVSKKFGFPWGFGRIWFGVSRFGYSLVQSGIYQKRKGKNGQIFVRENFYWPVDTQTEERDRIRLIFAQGVQTWLDLDLEDKDYFRALHYPTNMSGYNRFMSLWLKALL